MHSSLTYSYCYGLLSLDPVESGGETEHAHEGSGGLLIARCNGSPLFEPGPEPLDDVAVVVDPGRTGYRRFIGFGWDRRFRTQAPDVFAEAVAGIAAISHKPARHTRQAVEQWNGFRQLVRLTGRDPESNRSSQAVGDHASLGAIAATRAAKCFTIVSLSLRAPFRRAPAAFW